MDVRPEASTQSYSPARHRQNVAGVASFLNMPGWRNGCRFFTRFSPRPGSELEGSRSEKGREGGWRRQTFYFYFFKVAEILPRSSLDWSNNFKRSQPARFSPPRKRRSERIASLWKQRGAACRFKLGIYKKTPLLLHESVASSPGSVFCAGCPLSRPSPMANQSQCLDDAPFRGFRYWDPSPPQPYSEAQRLALEELIAGGRVAFLAFLRREKVGAFLSEHEIQAVLRAAVPPPRADESFAADPALNTSLDCSSLTYFPAQSDVEPPVLELGWPAFVSGSFRGLTRVEAYFQPSFGETIYPCKEVVRKQIRLAREVSERGRVYSRR